MKSAFYAFALASLCVGCTPDFFTQPPIPAVPPAKPVEAKAHGPVTPGQINEQNARQKLTELDAELEDDAKIATPKS